MTAPGQVTRTGIPYSSFRYQGPQEFQPAAQLGKKPHGRNFDGEHANSNVPSEQYGTIGA